MPNINDNDEMKEFFIANGFPIGYNDGLLAYLRAFYSVTHSSLPDLLARFRKEFGNDTQPLVPPFSPDDISDLQLWMDASNLASITESGGAVSQWNDLSGQGNHASQALASRQPATGVRTQNGLNILDFSVDFLQTNSFSSPLSQPNTIIIMSTRDNLLARYLFDGIVITNRHAAFVSSSLLAMFGGAPTLSSATASDMLPHINTLRFDTTSSEYWLDGTSIAAGATGALSLTGLNIGSRFNDTSHLGGAIGEILIYNKVLTNTERTDVEAHLSTKWGI